MAASSKLLPIHIHTSKLDTCRPPHFLDHFILPHFVFEAFYVLSLEDLRTTVCLLALACVSLKDLKGLFDFSIAALLHLHLLLHQCRHYYCLCYRYYASFFSLHSLNSLNDDHHLLPLKVLKVSRNQGLLHFFSVPQLMDWVVNFSPTDVILILTSC